MARPVRSTLLTSTLLIMGCPSDDGGKLDGGDSDDAAGVTGSDDGGTDDPDSGDGDGDEGESGDGDTGDGDGETGDGETGDGDTGDGDGETGDGDGDTGGTGDHEMMLADAIGFGRNAEGGVGGPIVHVTTLADAGPGSLREALESDGAAWVAFDLSGVIDLQSHIDVTSFKTVDGRGEDVTISGWGLRIQEVDHVVVTHMSFDSGADDAIKIIDGAHDVWINQSTFADYGDGLVDITRGGTDVTVSNCHFHTHDTVMLIGASPEEGDLDMNIRVTLHGNFFDDTNQRHPHIRFGRLHAFNNYYSGWGHSGIQYNYEAQVASEANVFAPDVDTRAVLHRWAFDMMGNPGAGRSVGDLLLDSATAMEYNPEQVFEPSDEYPYAAMPATEELAAEIAGNAGFQAVSFP